MGDHLSRHNKPRSCSVCRKASQQVRFDTPSPPQPRPLTMQARPEGGTYVSANVDDTFGRIMEIAEPYPGFIDSRLGILVHRAVVLAEVCVFPNFKTFARSGAGKPLILSWDYNILRIGRRAARDSLGTSVCLAVNGDETTPHDDAIMITDSGKRDERPVGILTTFDIPKLLDAVDTPRPLGRAAARRNRRRARARSDR